MLFNSSQFLFIYLPIVLVGFFALSRLGSKHLAALWLAVASFAFYGWDDPWRLLPIITGSAIFNYLIGRILSNVKSPLLLFFGVAGNLLLLAHYKYAGFLSENIAYVVGGNIAKVDIVLPIGISFYTFTQIAFLVDAYRGEAREYNPIHYGLFVSFFPHLIAGPILHHKEMMPQFREERTYRFDIEGFAFGLAWFALGLFKKVVLADNVSDYADIVFNPNSAQLTTRDAWIGAIAYSLQLYFDFSGYSDMAIGLARMFGITFPLNFNSPYKAASLVDFWRRWHMTLSRFLRDYLYIPLGGNRSGRVRRYINLLTTMVLGGLWHGASWNFALWGLLHGLGLVVNHLWQASGRRLPLAAAKAFTLVFVVFAWVPFRAPTLTSTGSIWSAMIGFGGDQKIASLDTAVPWIIALTAIALFGMNSQELMTASKTKSRIVWYPSGVWAVSIGILFGFAIAGMMSKPTSFLYFRF